MITADDVIENYDNFVRYVDSMPIDKASDSAVPAVSADLELDPKITLAMIHTYGMSTIDAAIFFHGMTYVVWLLREKKGL